MIKARQRQNLVVNIEKHFALDTHVKEAFLAVDREVFVPNQFKHLSYNLDALPLAASQWISSPLTVAKMTQHLELKGVDSILEVGMWFWLSSSDTFKNMPSCLYHRTHR